MDNENQEEVRGAPVPEQEINRNKLREFIDGLALAHRSWNDREQTLQRRADELQRVQRRYLNGLSHQTALKAKQRKPNPLTNFKVAMYMHNQSEALAEVALNERKLEQLRREAPEQNSTDNQLRAIQRHPFVESIKWVEWTQPIPYSERTRTDKYLVVYTAEIETTYRDLDGLATPVNLGKYKIIWKEQERLPKVVNLTYPEIAWAHPCIAVEHYSDSARTPRNLRGGNVCIGTFDEPLKVNAKAKRLDLVLDTFIHYLLTVESTNPYRNIIDFVNDIGAVPEETAQPLQEVEHASV